MSRQKAVCIRTLCRAEIAREVTAAHPRPVTLRMDKVYYPCILQTKKRYVGFAYESADQTEPVFDAKGIETVRRDSCPAVAKMLESCLRVLFSSKDLSAVKEYCTRQWGKILSNRVSIQVNRVIAHQTWSHAPSSVEDKAAGNLLMLSIKPFNVELSGAERPLG